MYPRLRNLYSALIGITFLTIAAPVAASLDGTWWEPAQPGTGWNCSAQDDTLFCLEYSYENPGAQPTFRSIIADLSYTILSDGDLQISAVGDVYRTVNFNQTSRTGPFSGVYDHGLFHVDAAGFVQDLVPFNFSYPNSLSSITGFYLTSTIPFQGGQGVSRLYAISDLVRSGNGYTYKDAFGPGVPAGVLIAIEGAGVILFPNGLPFSAEADAQFFTDVPVGYGVLFGAENWKGRVGFGCRITVATGACITPGFDVLLSAIANSAGEATALSGYFVTGKQQQPAPRDAEGAPLELAHIAAKLREQAMAFARERVAAGR